MLVQNHTNAIQAGASEAYTFRFGPFTLDMGRNLLSRNGAAIPLRPKTFDVLVYLLRHPGQVVSREELMLAVWPNVIVTDDSLTHCLTEIRKALGDDGRDMVQTVPRRGYLLDLPVEVTPQVVTGTASNRLSWWQPGYKGKVAVLIAALVFATGVWKLSSQSLEPTDTATVNGLAPEPIDIAVLPFVDLSEAGDQEYLAYGISEEILNMLTQSPGLTVIARTSSFAFANQNLDILAIARRLNVAHVLEGSVRKAGDQVRVTAQLIDGATGVHIWSHSYDERIDDVFTLQRGIAAAVTDVLTSKLATDMASQDQSDPALISTNMEAWSLYLRGKYFYGRRAAGDLLLAQENFEQALQLDPDFAGAWMGLANSLFIRSVQESLPDEEKLPESVAIPLMIQAISNALELDPRNPEAHIRMAMMQFRFSKPEEVMEHVFMAMQYGRNNALVQSILAGMARFEAGIETAITLHQRSVRLDPVSYTYINNLAYLLYSTGRFDDAAAVLQLGMEISPTLKTNSVELSARLALLKNDLATAATLADQLPAGLARDQVLSMLLYRQGEMVKADEALQRLLQREDMEALVAVTNVYGFRKDLDAAFPALDRATVMLLDNVGKEKDLDQAYSRGFFIELRSSPFLQPLHADPRWHDWLERTESRLRTPVDTQLAEALKRYAVNGSFDGLQPQ